MRTQDGREVDLLLESEDGFIAIEIKATENANRSDAKHLFELQEILNKPLLHGFVLSNDVRTQHFWGKIKIVQTMIIL